MGNRVSIIVESKDFLTPIELYGHWGGDYAIDVVRDVLANTDRIGDPAYLTAQLFWQFGKRGGYDGRLSFGISAFGAGHNWNDNPNIIVNADTGEYCIEGNESITEFARNPLDVSL